MTTWSDYPHGRYDGQPETEDGCIVPVPAEFLGMPQVPLAGEPDEYVTEVSVLSFDDGRQALYSPCLREPEPEAEAPELEPEAGP